MNRTRNLTLVALLAVTGLTVFSGCKSDSPSGPQPDALVKPKQGSSYTFATYETDSVNQKVPGSDATITFTVGATGVAIGNRTDCYRIDPSTDSEDTMYLNYASNGDVAMYRGLPTDEFSNDTRAWINLPFGSKAETKVTLIDTVINDGTGDVPMKVESTTKYAGTETITVAGSSFNTQKAQWIITLSTQLFGLPMTVTSTSTMWFAPKIGYIVKIEAKTVGGVPGLATSSSGHYETLSSYSMQ